MNALPAIAQEPKRTAAPVLVVDDDPVILDALCAQLACDGWEVIACTTPSDALAALRSRTFATILTDQNMPEMKGLEFLTRAREIQPAATRLLITGILSTGTLVEAINHGEIYRFLSKPWTRAELLVSIRNAVQRYEMTIAHEQLHQEIDVLRAKLAATQAELQRVRSSIVEEVPPSRIVSSGAGLLTQNATPISPVAGRHAPPEEARLPHVHLVGYC